MAAMRRVFCFVSRSMKNNFITSLRMDHIGEMPKRKLKSLKPGVAGMCVAAGGAVAYYYYCHVNNSNRGKGLVFNIINNKTDLLPSLPAVAAKEQSRGLDFEDGDVYISSHEQRFRMFSSVEYEGQLYMTPQNFIESVTMDEPKYRRQWKSLSKQELEQILSATPPVWRGTSKLFRNLRDGGIIAYTEYLFLLCILTKPHAGFKIAFKMFDADGNQMVDKKEFLVLQEIFRKKNEKKGRKGDAEKSAQLRAEESMMVDTTLLMHFFGKKGKAELNYDDFYRFMDNLQTEVLEIEFLTYSKGMTTISEEDFARILLRYTNVENISSYLDSVRQRISEEKGLTFDEFRSFFQFLNNLEDFAIAMQMYNFANRSIGQDEFKRAVYVATGLKLSQHLVNTVFKIFDVDRDEQLSYKEFIGIMKDRLHRGSRVARQYGVSAFFTCVKAEVRKHCKRLWRRYKENI
ncbi:calcium uptake protein 3, mitochondrial-like isoform X7 [Acipenser ruthenus]|uniref:calcium uptake protein 3, mitochondrial-like isoform X7 n=1 Tax=Acipenser ruthenus TaxID=7906 RepID=UPI0027406221|nr:calcium uptake protein 3, mitochondrial-like isoform X7 [Acipenser ruthenus]